jgi:hypothetical protein
MFALMSASASKADDMCSGENFRPLISKRPVLARLARAAGEPLHR